MGCDDCSDINGNLFVCVSPIVETGIGATAISELMVKKELQFGVLKALTIQQPSEKSRQKGDPKGSRQIKEQLSTDKPMQRSFTLIKHQERFQTRIAQAFEQILRSQPDPAEADR